MTEDDVPDSTDWLATPLSGLAAVENALRCQVCKDFYKTPMITSCCHTFCSLCIRRALSNDGKCPLCRKSEQEMKLRSNWPLEETVDAFVKARPTTLELARNAAVTGPISKRKAEDSSQTSNAPEGKRLRTSARLRKGRKDATRVEAIQDEEEREVFEVSDDDEYVPEPEDGLVPCPVCQTRMKEWQVFKHLESCLGPTPKKQKAGPSTSASSFGQQQQQQQRQQNKPDRLPAINYSMLKEQALRKKLSEIGIPSQGPRHLLEKRHKEWITLWNANCDAARPKKRSELLQDLDVWERTQGGRVTMGRSFQPATMVKDKEFDGDAWATKHDSSFKDLISSARKSRMEAKKKAEEAAKSSGTASQAPSGPLEPPQQGTQSSAAGQTQNSTIPIRNENDNGMDPFPSLMPNDFYDNPSKDRPPLAVAMRSMAPGTQRTESTSLGASPLGVAQPQTTTTTADVNPFHAECAYEETQNYHFGMAKAEFEGYARPENRARDNLTQPVEPSRPQTTMPRATD
ncbi:Fc.00g085770.m01.CDS01 [Cosmosporella sp. VM-42]